MKTRISRPRALTLLVSLTQAFALAGNPALASPGSGRVGEFIGDGNYSLNVYEIAARAGNQGAAAEQPWSGSYWPLHSGSIANAYNEDGASWLNNTARKLKSVKGNFRHQQKRLSDLRDRRKNLDDATLQELAPSEKYDLFLGDDDFTFTRAIWASLLEQNDRIGKLALWEGSCHGWATSSAWVTRPKNLIRVMSLDGRYLIPFYPDDLKALATVLWANSLVQDSAIVLGKRCKESKPKIDPSNGKVLSESCQGINPGDLHPILLELMGARKQTFIINRVNNTQVWNQPVANYELKYFNLVTGKRGELRDSIVARAQFPDPFARYRAEEARSLVGVEMKLRYTAERNPSHRKSDEPGRDKIKGLKIHYDLELDSDLNIVGGEWISSEAMDGAENGVYSDPEDDVPQSSEPPPYPGFVWKFPTPKPEAYSIADFDLPGNDPLAMDRQAVVRASRKASEFRYRYFSPRVRTEQRPQPLAKIVNYLIRLSHEATGPQEK